MFPNGQLDDQVVVTVEGSTKERLSSLAQIDLLDMADTCLGHHKRHPQEAT